MFTSNIEKKRTIGKHHFGDNKSETYVEKQVYVFQ